MEWVKIIGNSQRLCCGDIILEVCPARNGEGWHWWVCMQDNNYSGSTDTEERAKRFAIYEAHRIIRDLVNDLAEITGENYHLELN